MVQSLSGIKACVFDAYGTLFDFNSAAAKCRDALGEQADALSALWRDKQLQYTWLRSLMGQYTPFWTVTGEALDYAMDALDINDQSLRDRLMSCYRDISAFPEVPDMLRRLKKAGLKTAILTNGSPDMVEAGMKASGIADLLDNAFSVDTLGVYKPDPRVYQMAVDGLGIEKHQIAFQSSNAWDANGASAFGSKRFGSTDMASGVKGCPPKPAIELTSLADFPKVVGI